MDPSLALFWGLYAVTGAVVGVLAGLLGVGGGLIIVPALTVLFEAQGFPSAVTLHLALGTSLSTILFTSISSTRAHHRHQAVDWSIVAKITPGILLGTYLGGVAAARMHTPLLKGVFAVFLFLVAIQMISGARPQPTRKLPSTPATGAVGLLIGGVSGLVGIGGGSMSVPFMIWCNITVRRAIGTSAAIGFPIAAAGAASYIVNGMAAPTGVPHALGYVHLPALAGVALFSMLTAPLGARLTSTLDPARIKRAFAYLLLFMGVRMLWGIVTK